MSNEEAVELRAKLEALGEEPVYMQENEELKKEICTLREALEQAEDNDHKKDETIYALRRNASFLEGQVSAFRFCFEKGVQNEKNRKDI